MSSPAANIGSPQYDKSLLKSIGDDVFISANVEIRRPQLVSMGSHVAIDTGFYLTTAAELGDYIHISPYITVIGGQTALLKMDSFSGMAAGCRIICGSDDLMGNGLFGPTIPEKYHDTLTVAPVVFERFVNISTNVVVMPGVTLGEGCVIGACSLVTKSTEPWTVYIGVPARPVKVRPKGNMLEYAKRLGY